MWEGLLRDVNVSLPTLLKEKLHLQQFILLVDRRKLRTKCLIG